MSQPTLDVSVAEEEVIVKEVQAVLAVTRWYHTVHQSTFHVNRIIELAVTAVVFTTFVPATSVVVQAVEAAAALVGGVGDQVNVDPHDHIVILA